MDDFDEVPEDDPFGDGEEEIRILPMPGTEPKVDKPPPAMTRSHATPEEVDRRIETTCDLILQGHREAAIVATLRQNYHVSHTTARRYLAAARKRIFESTGTSRDEARTELWASINQLRSNLAKMYMQALKDETATYSDKVRIVRAQARLLSQIAELCGLNAPKAIHIHETKSENLEYLDRVIDQFSIDELIVIDRLATLSEHEQNVQMEKIRLKASAGLEYVENTADENRTPEPEEGHDGQESGNEAENDSEEDPGE